MNSFLLTLPIIFLPGNNYIKGDLNTFYFNDTTSYLEYVYFISPEYLKIIKKKYFDLEIKISIFDGRGKKVVSDYWKKRYNFTDETSYITDIFSCILKPDTYNLIFNFKTREFEITIDTVVYLQKIETVCLSDIQIVKDISSQRDKYPFKRYNLSFIPAPFFSYPDSFAWYYFEIYNSPQKVLLSLEIIDTLGKIWLSNLEEKEFSGKMNYITGRIPLFPLRAGEYSLRIKILDTLENFLTERIKKFIYLSELYLYQKMAREKYEDYISFIDYFATKEEIEEFKRLEGKSRIIFLKKFWKKFDPDPETQANEFLVIFINRVKYADENFSTVNVKGRYTDRGRIYIKYGPPDEVKRNPYPLENYSWESWFYRTPVKNQYIFVDLKNDGDYKLIYSSNPQEPGRADWTKYIPQEEIDILR